MSELRRRLRRFGLWLVALALGFAAAALVAWIVAEVFESEPDGSEQFAAAFWGVVTWAACGLVAIWWFARPRRSARRWVTFGIPVLAAVTLLATQTVGAVAMLGYPLIWVGAFWAALLPYEPESNVVRARR